MLPILIDVLDKAVLIVGDGRVGQRKAKLFSDQGALVRLWGKGDGPVPDGVLLDAHLVVLATDDPGVNGALMSRCKAFGLWCNRVDSTEDNDFHTMATLWRGDLSVSVATNGKQPAVSKVLKEVLEGLIPQDFEDLLAPLVAARSEILRGPYPSERERDMAMEDLKQGVKEAIKQGINQGIKLAIEKDLGRTDNGR